MIESPPTLASSALSSLHQGRRRFTVLRPLSTASRDAESNYSASSSSDVEDSCFQTAPSSPAMTSPPPHHRHSEPRDAIDNDPFSDYGSDISLDDNLLQLLDAAVPASSSVSPSRTDPLPTSHPNPTAVFQEHDNLDDARIDVLEHAAVVHPAVAAKGVLQSEGFPSVDPASSPNYEATRDEEEDAVVSGPSGTGTSDSRSPYERFRSKKKALTVTDLVSNVWCEQQLEYTLVRGFKRSTPAMKRGTSVHRVLEEQVHTVVPVDVKTKEDRWGLKLFNMYQGLSCLEHEGLTREFPVFGFINDILVRGIIDELIYQDPAIKTKGSETTNEEGVYKKIRRNSKADRERTPEVYNVPSAGKRQVYISDAKSRGTRSLPTSSQARATALQLMAYHRLLEQMRSGQTDFARLLKHYSLDGEAKFSDSLIADIAGVNPDMPIELLLDHNSLLGMWELMRQQMTVSIDSMGNNMGISYRDQTEGRIFAYQTIAYDSTRLDAHLDSVLSWWRGERATVGVEIEEAWKCSSCEFEANCAWRLGKLAELKKSKRKGPAAHPWAKSMR